VGGWTAAAAPARLCEDKAGQTGDREGAEDDGRAGTAAAAATTDSEIQLVRTPPSGNLRDQHKNLILFINTFYF
jgi:hypothetical protein